ncbi:hypothetical protein JAAARDRAFT_190398 [Jaapia argillacea MUCL 33604]|uniref:Uncharacterized protein n=1 Tax=Jaapia argillacea MUCL 33604 TaxID=933084 RepID=A0A067QDT3_9AGAM|nr:hypothetical protein JAAARDRAFT_190398 [Jaapia argillacea MUCL 33604]
MSDLGPDAAIHNRLQELLSSQINGEAVLFALLRKLLGATFENVDAVANFNSMTIQIQPDKSFGKEFDGSIQATPPGISTGRLFSRVPLKGAYTIAAAFTQGGTAVVFDKFFMKPGRLDEGEEVDNQDLRASLLNDAVFCGSGFVSQIEPALGVGVWKVLPPSGA